MIYCRLSKDDEKICESESIQNQRAMLEQYCEQWGYEVVLTKEAYVKHTLKNN